MSGSTTALHGRLHGLRQVAAEQRALDSPLHQADSNASRQQQAAPHHEVMGARKLMADPAASPAAAPPAKPDWNAHDMRIALFWANDTSYDIPWQVCVCVPV